LKDPALGPYIFSPRASLQTSLCFFTYHLVLKDYEIFVFSKDTQIFFPSCCYQRVES